MLSDPKASNHIQNAVLLDMAFGQKLILHLERVVQDIDAFCSNLLKASILSDSLLACLLKDETPDE